ncbi:MAG: response regulator [Verrucomicrobiae bacterium]|nr:response regulator [Verrucomicrobiae bacterium]
MNLPEHPSKVPAAFAGGRPQANAFRVLIVDDQAQNRLILSQILARVGYEVETANNGAEALNRVVCQPRPDLILTDVEMPVMDGIESVRLIRKMPEAIARIPVLAASGSPDPILKRDMLLAGADAYLAKPVNVPELLETVGRMIRESIGRKSPESRISSVNQASCC